MLRQLEDLWNTPKVSPGKKTKTLEPPEFKEISKEKIRQTVKSINAKLKGSDGKTESDRKAKPS